MRTLLIYLLFVPLAWACEDQLQYSSKAWEARFRPDFDPARGQEELAQLRTINDLLRRGAFKTRKALIEAGIIEPDFSAVAMPIPGTDRVQKLKYSRLLLPYAHTGMLIPRNPTDPKEIHRGINLIASGIGTTRSNALTVTTPAQRLTIPKGKNRGEGRYGDRSELGDIVHRKGTSVKGTKGTDSEVEIGFRLFSIPIDITGGGMQKDAPDALIGGKGALVVAEHALLVVRILFPMKPVVFSGRSQGGLIAMQMGERFGPKDGLFAVNAINPSPTDLASIQASILHHEDPERLKEVLEGAELVPRTWAAYALGTLEYELLPKSKVPVLIQQGKGDQSYDEVLYAAWIARYLASDPKHRSVITYGPDDAGVDPSTWLKRGMAHDLWHSAGAMKPVLGDLRKFLEAALPR